MSYSLATVLAAAVIGFIAGVAVIIVASCLIISSEESRREENEVNRR